MMFDIPEMIKSLAEACKSLFDFFKTKKEKQAESEIITDKNTLKKATNLAEEIITNTEMLFAWVSDLCWDIMDFRQRRQFVKFVKRHKKLKKQFEKNN